MKRLFGLVIVVVALMGCVLPSSSGSAEDMQYKTIFRTAIYRGDFSSVKTQADITPWIKSHIRYQADPTGSEVVNSLTKTVELGYSDCEEMALMYLDILYIKFDIKGQFLCVDSSARHVGTGGATDHALVRVDGVQIDPKTGRVCDFPVAFYYDFDDLFY